VTLLVSNVNNLLLFELSWNYHGALSLGPLNPLNLAFVVSSGTNCEMTHALSAVLVTRMIFNLREAGTEIYEGTREWATRVDQSVRDMQFRIPSLISVESMVDESERVSGGGTIHQQTIIQDIHLS